ADGVAAFAGGVSALPPRARTTDADPLLSPPSPRHVDWALVLLALAAAGLGWLALRGGAEGSPRLLAGAQKQLLWLLVGAVVAAAATLFDYRRLARFIPHLYAANLTLLAGVLVVGEAIKGSRAWFDFGLFNYQPSETMKVVAAAALAQWFATRPEPPRRLAELSQPALLVGAPMALVMLQPDLGTTLVFGVLAAAVCYWAGVPMRLLAMVAVACLALGAAAYPVLKPYQKERIKVFLDPERDPRGAGYNVIQSRIAIGSGGLLGKGWKEGTQSTFGILPEHQTDFIFASAVEQFGAAGGAAIIALMLGIATRLLRAVDAARDRFGGLLVAGLAAVFCTHAFFNIAMTMGLVPVTGLPLPLLSYGGSFMLTTGLSLGLALNVGARRYWFD
ncbi:MAG: rod shape-determining protein RodA, partial [Candidatus Sumerlaeia bacterium]|nr:rod shape-determining protein RodA [Candidatus Sumerlaeia bacterium]